jgi:hypothetical protein
MFDLQIPTIIFERSDEIADFHAWIIEAFSGAWKPHNG